MFASELTALFAAIVHLTPVLGGWIADQYLNRYRTIGTFLVVYILGLTMVALAAWPQTNSLPLALLGLLGFVAVGAGGIKANVVTFGADQFNTHDPAELKQQERFFGYFYMTINIGAIFSFGFLSNLSFNPEFFSGGLISEEYGYFATYVIPLVFLLIASEYQASTDRNTWNLTSVVFRLYLLYRNKQISHQPCIRIRIHRIHRRIRA